MRQTKQERMRIELPYGMWVCDDGREVLFNRRYQPIRHRRVGERGIEADPTERVEFISERWFYTDANPPWRSMVTKRECEELLQSWDDHF